MSDLIEKLNNGMPCGVNALNGLRSRREEVNRSKSGRDHSPVWEMAICRQHFQL